MTNINDVVAVLSIQDVIFEYDAFFFSNSGCMWDLLLRIVHR